MLPAARPRKWGRRQIVTPRRKLHILALLVIFGLSLEPALETLQLWLAYRGEALLRVDYSLYVLSALQGMHQGWHHLYDLEAQRRTWQELPLGWWFPNVFTPALSVVMIPFTHLSRDAGYALWSAILFACMLVSWHFLAPGDWKTRLALLPMLFVSYPVQLGLWLGQILAVQLAGLGLCYFLLRRGHERAAALPLIVIALKPQGMLLVPFALLAAGKRKLFVTWAACMAVMGVGVLALVGLDGAAAYLARLAYAKSHPLEFWVAWSYSLPRRIDNVALLQLVELLAAATALFAAWRHRERPEIAIAAGLAGSLVAAPFLHIDDFVLLFPAGWLLLRASPVPLTAGFLLLGYASMLSSNTERHDGRWILLFACVFLPALAALPWRRADPQPEPAGGLPAAAPSK
jgi:hypothetical protein